MAFKEAVEFWKRISPFKKKDEDKNEELPDKAASQSKKSGHDNKNENKQNWARRSQKGKSSKKKSIKSTNKGEKDSREDNSQGWRSQMETASTITRGNSIRRSKDSAYGSFGRKSGRRKKANYDQKKDSEGKPQAAYNVEHDAESDTSDMHDADNGHPTTEAEIKPHVLVHADNSPNETFEETSVGDMVRNYERRQAIVHGDETAGELVDVRQHQLNHDTHRNYDDDLEELTEEEIQELYEICDELKKVLDDHKVPYFSIYQDPFNNHQICVQGPNITGMRAELVSTVLSDESKFYICTKDMNRKPKEPPSVTDWVNTKSVPPSKLAEQDGNNNHELSVTELFLTGYDKRRSWPRLDYYGTTTAHSFMSLTQRESPSFFRKDFLDDWMAVIQSSWEKKHHLLCQYQQSLDILPPPFLLYSYWHPCWVEENDAWLLDLAMFKLDERQLVENGWLSPEDSGNVAAMRQDTNGHIVRIQDASDLRSFHGKRILCSGKTGRIRRAPDNVNEGNQFGLHLAFTLSDRNQTLESGTCGSLVYLLESSKAHLPIIGMFFGSSKLDPDIHQAIVVSKAIERMENIREYYIESLQLMP